MNGNSNKTNKHNIHRHRRSISVAQSVSFSAILCALGVVILYLGALIETMDITMATLASFLVIVCMIEISGYMPYLTYAVTFAISLLLLPNKTVGLIYGLFFGYYPILKNYLEKLPLLWSWAAKFATFNAAIFLCYTFARQYIFPDIDSIKIYLILILNVILFTLDLAQTLFVTAYVRKFRKMLGIHRFFK